MLVGVLYFWPAGEKQRLRRDPNSPTMAATFTRCLVRLRCNTVVCVSVKQWPFFWATTVELNGCQFFLFSEALFGFKEFTFRPCRRPSLCFPFLSSPTPPIRSTWPSAIIHHCAPLQQPGPSYCQRLNMGILSPPVLSSLCHHFICVQPAFAIWYLYQSGISDSREKQICPFTQQVLLVTSAARWYLWDLPRLWRKLHTLGVGGRGRDGALNKQAMAV